jgi:hypothetical protein
LAACQYRHFEAGTVDFTCSNYCIFHDTDYRIAYYPKFEQEAVKEFDKKLSKSKDFLKCIGYALPASHVASKLLEITRYMELDFTAATFLGPASFFPFEEDVKFKIIFRETKFEGEVYFSGITFKGKMDFSDAKFKDKAEFMLTTFEEEVEFYSTEFHEVTFLDTSFVKGIHFDEAHFLEKTRFIGNDFVGHTSFYYSYFADYAHFADRVLADGKVLDTFSADTSFAYAVFGSKEKVYFEVKDLSKVSFMNADITRVKFYDKVRWGVEDRFKVVEEERFELDNSYSTLDGVMSVYRNLRENYEYRLRYDDAGKFFIREMELKRKYRESFNIGITP